ncbi:MAG: FkbM family methyltransferase [Selenomonadaceae bacterium]|nr:FkbM family methyltransferase [Selenomonadaceae bacterium]
MKNFVKLIQQAYKEYFPTTVQKLVDNKIPFAFLSRNPTDKIIAAMNDLRAHKLNISSLIIISPPPVNLDINVIQLKEAVQIYPQPEYIFTADIIDSRLALKNFPASKVVTCNKTNPKSWYKAFMTHLDELQNVYESLIDEESNKTFCGYWLAHTSNQLGRVIHSKVEHYMCPGFIPEKDAIILEAGAYDGGTATILSEMGYRVYTFEMDKINFDRTSKVAEEKNFVVENMALGSYKHMLRYAATGKGNNSLKKSGEDLVEVITLDSYVRDKNLPCVDMIKLDVEGAELDILKGAKTTIARYKPILALSAYHKEEDFWTLMNFVKSIRPDYEFALRHCYENPEDEPMSFKNGVDHLINLGLEPDLRNWWECILFAR